MVPRIDTRYAASIISQVDDPERTQLDVYYPPATPSSTAPVLFFVYGGGYGSGDRRLPAPFSLVYANLGAFYAEKGLVGPHTLAVLVSDILSDSSPSSLITAFCQT